jgi:alpha-glucosidase
LLHHTRAVLALRNAHPALRWGSLDIVEASEAMLVFDRLREDSRLRCTFNLSNQWQATERRNAIFTTGEVQKDALAPYAAFIEVI